MRCVGYDPYQGKCENKAGTPWSRYWCPRCDLLRMEAIEKQFEAMKANTEAKGAAKDG